MSSTFTLADGLKIRITRHTLSPDSALAGLEQRLDGARGCLFSSGVDYPGRYSRWAFGFEDPPLEIVGRERRLTLRALNPRGEVLLDLLQPILLGANEVPLVRTGTHAREFEVAAADRPFAEEERSRQPSLMSPLRRLIHAFRGIEDRFLGLYGAFGYDLLFRFEPMALRHGRGVGAKDVHLFLPDRIIAVDRRKEEAFRLDYDFERGELATEGLSRTAFLPLAAATRARPASTAPRIDSDLGDAEYAAMVERARKRIHVGDVFEVVLSRTFHAPYAGAPSQLYERMTAINPSPYEFLIQLGDEQLIGTSPEMFVRVEGERVESCPISGTARRGNDAMEDAARLKALINSEKDEVELTMCTDVDRNDKARVCRPGSVRLLARRQIETYAGLFHTVDHVEGRLREGFDGIDAFLSHMWAVTLTGAPKRMAASIVEAEEGSARGWYGGAIGALLFNGDVNTGITIRTIHLKDGVARYRVGATIVWDSTGEEEERETRTKSTTLFRALAPAQAPSVAPARPMPGKDKRIVLIDNEDSFVHTLADYFRQTGAEVATYRHGMPADAVAALGADLIVHSPGPARPADFGVPDLVRALAARGVPQFGVCLGLQGMVEAFGGTLDILTSPRHGKTWSVAHDGEGVFKGLPLPMSVGAYHSLTARMSGFPHGELVVSALNETGLVMAVRHRRLPIAAVQFHPESILSAAGGVGHALIANVVRELATPRNAAAAE
jgi:anthranilate synthase